MFWEDDRKQETIRDWVWFYEHMLLATFCLKRASFFQYISQFTEVINSRDNQGRLKFSKIEIVSFPPKTPLLIPMKYLANPIG